MNHVSVKLSYKASGLGGIKMEDLDELVEALKENYISHIAPNPGPQAGGLIDAFVEVILDTTFVDFFKVLRDGFIFDTFTRGKKSFVLKPLFDAFGKMESKNENWDYTIVRLLFNDTKVVIYGMSNMFTSRLNIVLSELSKHYNKLNNPHEIFVPVTRRVDNEGKITYAAYGGDDFADADYKSYWGISYHAGFDRKVYDVKADSLIDIGW